MSDAEQTPMSTPVPRRTVVRAGVLGAGAAVVGGSLVGDRTVRAGAPPHTPPGRLVVVYLRGGQDHLSTVVPYADGHYYDRRPDIAIPDDRVLPLDASLGLHPRMAGLHALYQTGSLAVVAGAGNPAGSRSHFDAQDLSEFGVDTAPNDRRGWIGRHLAATAGDDDSLFRAVTGASITSVSLRGFDALAIPTIEQFGLGGQSGFALANESMLRVMYAGDELVEKVGTAGIDASSVVSSLQGASGADVAAVRFADVAELLAADIGVEVVTLDLGGWDTHDPMGTWDRGIMQRLLGQLDGYLSGFHADLEARGLDDVTTVVMTEFGRRVDQNGTRGTEHGWGSVMLAMGARVNGGQVYGGVPTLTSANTPRGDVPVAVDFRNVLSEVATVALGSTDSGVLFPGHAASPVGVMS